MLLPHADYLMLIQGWDTTADFAVALLIHYSFDLGGYTASQLIEGWLKNYSATWVRSAVVEALYQGRYKAISVEQILAFWQRRGLALYHFNHEFERLICSNLPQTLVGHLDLTAIAALELDQADCSNVDDAVVTSSASEKMTVNCVDVTTSTPPARNTFSQVAQSHDHSDNESPLSSIAKRPPIQHFMPEADDKNEFYTKLRAIAQHSEAEQTH